MVNKEVTTTVPVVLCGGSGTRLWPLSREAYPKQFWPLVSTQTMLQETLSRASGASFAAPMVICNEAHRFLVAEQLRAVGNTAPRIVLEPAARNSAPAIAAAALLVHEENPQAIMWIMPADAVIKDTAALSTALSTAITAAKAGYIVTFGMKATAPETGYGYIETGAEIAAAPGTQAVARFVEKPDLAAAEKLVAGGKHLWNSGMFVCTAATMLAELERLAPEVLSAARAAVENSSRDLDFVRLDQGAFESAPNISIDYTVMEKTSHAAVVPADIGWSDVGSWAALWEVSDKDEAGNATQGPVELLDAERCLVRSEGVLTTVVGLQDAVIVVTDDAILAMHRDHSQNVKKIVERLKAKGIKQATEHRRMYRPWGHYEGLIQGDRFQVKKISVKPGAKLSLQKHFHRAEHWVVVNGTAIVERDAERILLRENESVYLPLGCVHRMENPGMIPLTLIEVQSGAYLGEDDIVRFEDTYGRA
ncbi:mannose-1-phosphate guanylyltransferase/mannose-6-phosphate isomerase [Acetobacteraceae bacterium H6797]|nr:mannose-1-phosphate guanylyltransferase/mannose-6-phosphate isomerase [Acetobacteraceae bacterium H6797]